MFKLARTGSPRCVLKWGSIPKRRFKQRLPGIFAGRSNDPLMRTRGFGPVFLWTSSTGCNSGSWSGREAAVAGRAAIRPYTATDSFLTHLMDFGDVAMHHSALPERSTQGVRFLHQYDLDIDSPGLMSHQRAPSGAVFLCSKRKIPGFRPQKLKNLKTFPFEDGIKPSRKKCDLYTLVNQISYRIVIELAFFASIRSKYNRGNSWCGEGSRHD